MGLTGHTPKKSLFLLTMGLAGRILFNYPLFNLKSNYDL